MEHVIGIDAGGTKTVCLLADEHGDDPRAKRAAKAPTCRRSGELQVEKILHDGDGRGDRRPRASCRRRSASASPASIARTMRASSASIMRRIGYKARVARRQRRAGCAREPARRRAGRGDHRRHRVDRLRPQRQQARRRAPAAGATCSATRAAATGSAGRRCAPCCAPRTAAGRRRVLTQMLLEHFGVVAAAGADPRGLSQHLQAGGDRRAGAVACRRAFSEGDEAAVGILARRRRRARVVRRCRWRAGWSSIGRGVHVHPVGRHLPRRAVAGAGAARGGCRWRRRAAADACCSIGSPAERRRARSRCRKRRGGAAIPRIQD